MPNQFGAFNKKLTIIIVVITLIFLISTFLFYKWYKKSNQSGFGKIMDIKKLLMNGQMSNNPKDCESGYINNGKCATRTIKVKK